MPAERVHIDDLAIVYSHTGSGPAILLLHGWAQNADTWKSFIGALSSEYSIYALDLPGFGRNSYALTYAWTLDDYARFLNKFTETLHIEAPILIGHSFGARIAFSYAQLYPAKALVLAAMSDDTRSSMFRSLHGALIRIFGGIAPKLLSILHGSYASETYRYGTEIEKLQYARLLLDTFKKTHQIRKNFPGISLPTLLVYGKRDPITTVYIGSRICERIPGSTLQIVANAGHMVHTSSSFAAIVLSFLRQIAQNSRNSPHSD